MYLHFRTGYAPLEIGSVKNASALALKFMYILFTHHTLYNVRIAN